jgi:hypothetical protein
MRMPLKPTRRSADLDELMNKEIPGVYVLNVPKAIKTYFKIGISESDIERRVSSYILSYPFGFNIIGVILYKGDPISRYIKVREAESIILRHFKDKRVFRFRGMKTSEWLKLSTEKEINELKQLMRAIAKRDKAKVTFFGETHEITLPS